MSAHHSAPSKSITSTPLKNKSTIPKRIPRSRSEQSTGDSTYSLLSSIHHESFELSDEDHDKGSERQPRDDGCVTAHEERLSESLIRKDTVTTHIQDTCNAELNLSAWEQWLVDKAKKERIRLEESVLEQLTLKDKQNQEERDKIKKKELGECKIQEWLQMKKEQEKQEKLTRESHKTKERLLEEQKRITAKMKAEEKYKVWLHKKKEEEKERRLMELEEITRQEEEERERKEKAEEKFKEWLKSIKSKDRHKHQSACSDGYDDLNYPAPSFVNPVPWKPIHIPQGERTLLRNTARKKPQSHPKYCSTPCLSFKPKDTISFACKRR